MRIRILYQEEPEFSVYLYPAARTSIPTCTVGWRGGFAEVALGTWQVLGGDALQPALIEWLEENERYLWDVYGCYFL